MKARKIAKQIGLYLKRHLPEILAVSGSFGVVATAVLSGKASIKADALLNEASIAKKDELTMFEKSVVAGPSYIPTIVVGGATIACILGCHVLNVKQQMALASAYILLDRMFADYKKYILELYGKEADQKVSSAILSDKKTEIPEIVPTSDSNLRIFYQEHIGRFFRRTMLEVQDAEYQLNRKFATEGEASLNDFLEYLGLPKVEHGDVIGWSQEIICDYTTTPWIDFEHDLVVLEDGSECYHIHISETPEPLDQD